MHCYFVFGVLGVCAWLVPLEILLVCHCGKTTCVVRGILSKNFRLCLYEVFRQFTRGVWHCYKVSVKSLAQSSHRNQYIYVGLLTVTLGDDIVIVQAKLFGVRVVTASCHAAEMIVSEVSRRQMEETLEMVHRLQQRSGIGAHAPTSAADDDIITYYDCATHNVQTPDYVEYLVHLATIHQDFSRVDRKAIKSGNKMIQFKDGKYYCAACDLQTPIRVVFKVSLFCISLVTYL